MSKTKTGDYTLDWMYRNLPPEEITLANYIAINWCNEKTLNDLEGEELECGNSERFASSSRESPTNLRARRHCAGVPFFPLPS